MATFCETEIPNNHCVIIKENICEFEVSVHDLVFVQHLESIHDLFEVVDGFLLIDQVFRLLGEVPLEIPVVAILHDKVVVVAGLQELEEMHDVRVIYVIHHCHLSLQKFLQHRVFVYCGLLDTFDGVLFFVVVARG